MQRTSGATYLLNLRHLIGQHLDTLVVAVSPWLARIEVNLEIRVNGAGREQGVHRVTCGGKLTTNILMMIYGDEVSTLTLITSTCSSGLPAVQCWSKPHSSCDVVTAPPVPCRENHKCHNLPLFSCCLFVLCFSHVHFWPIVVSTIL